MGAESRQQQDVERFSRDELWQVSFEVYYDSYYGEILASKMLDIWLRVDSVAKIAIALATSGSALLGWVSWRYGFPWVGWSVFASAASLLAILHATLAVPQKIKDWGECQRRFFFLRVDLETYRSRMRIDPSFPIEDYLAEFIRYREQYKEGAHLVPSDFLLQRYTKLKAQELLNRRIRDQIAVNEEG